MSIISALTYFFSNGTVADATQVNANFAQIVSNVNANAAENGVNASITSLTGLTSSLPVPAATVAGQAVQAGQAPTIGWGGTSTGSANAQVIAPAIPKLAYAAGQKSQFKAGYTNTGAMTLAESALAGVAVQINGNALVGGEVVAGKIYTVLYDSPTTCQLQGFSTVEIEGTWTPVITSAGLTIPITAAVGSVVKIGSQVTVGFYIALGTVTGTQTGAVVLSGLPYMSHASYGYAGAGLREQSINGTAYTLFVGTNANIATLTKYDNTNAIVSGMSFIGSFTYRAAY